MCSTQETRNRMFRAPGLKVVCLGIALVSSVALLVLGVNSQSATAESESKPFEEKLWSYLIGNNYKNWAPGVGQSGDFYSGQNPHGALLKMYMNRTAIGTPNELRPGSVVILEDYRSDKSLKTVSVMYRTEGFNPSGNDWYWVAYNPDGSVVQERQAQALNHKGEIQMASAGGLKKVMGKATTCISCHQNAAGKDFAFFNDGTLRNMANRSNGSGASTTR